MELMTISEAAERLDTVRSQLYRLLNDGYREHVHVLQHTGQRLVDIEGLREVGASASGVPTACS